jgi:hypothetical protein
MTENYKEIILIGVVVIMLFGIISTIVANSHQESPIQTAILEPYDAYSWGENLMSVSNIMLVDEARAWLFDVNQAPNCLKFEGKGIKAEDGKGGYFMWEYHYVNKIKNECNYDIELRWIP